MISKVVILVILLSVTSARAQSDRHNTSLNQAWLSCKVSESPNAVRGEGHWILYTLDDYYALDSTHFWNFNTPQRINNYDNQSWSLHEMPGTLKDGIKKLAIDVSLEGDRSLLSVGSEHLFNGGIYGIRGGFNIGSDGRKSASMGAMYRYNDDFQFDYGFSLPIEGITSILGTHKLSITFRFGPSAPQLVDRAIEIKKHEKKIDSETEKIQRIKNKDELPRSKEILRKASEGNNVQREIKGGYSI